MSEDSLDLLKCGLVYDFLKGNENLSAGEIIQKISELKLGHKSDPEALQLLFNAQRLALNKEYRMNYPCLRNTFDNFKAKFGNNAIRLSADYRGGLLNWLCEGKNYSLFFGELQNNFNTRSLNLKPEKEKIQPANSGFSWVAFLMPPIWLVMHKKWRWGIAYIIVCLMLSEDPALRIVFYLGAAFVLAMNAGRIIQKSDNGI